MASKRGDVLLLSELKYADYVRYREEQARERLSPAPLDPVPASLQDDVSQRAERLIAEELASHFQSVLTSVGLTKDKERLKPINDELPKFKDWKHFKSTMQRLHTHSRTSSVTTLPATPGPAVTETQRRVQDSPAFFTLRKLAESQASADINLLRRQLNRGQHTSVTERIPPRPVSTRPQSPDDSLHIPLMSATPASAHLSSPKLTKKVLNHYINEVAQVLPKYTEPSTKASDEKKQPKIKLKRKRRIHRVKSAGLTRSSSPSASFLREPNMYRRIERSKAVNWRESEAIRQQVYWKRVLADIKSQYSKKRKHRSGSMGELMEIMFRKKPEINQDEAKHGDIAKFRTLNEKLYTMMKEDPADLHRIITQPEFMVRDR